MFASTLSSITAEACVPEQLVHYVRAVSGRRAMVCAGYAAYAHEGHAVLVAYPGSGAAETYRADAALWAAREEVARKAVVCAAVSAPANIHGGFALVGDGNGPDCAPGFNGHVAPLPMEAQPRPLAEALEELSSSCSSVTVLAPFRPCEAPDTAHSSRDAYWDMELPAPAPSQKLRNLLGRAAREVAVQPEKWGAEHEALVRHYLQTRLLASGTRAIFSALPEYFAKDEEGSVLLLAARRASGELAAFSVADYSALRTAFYMFSFRHQDAPPGTSDMLLAGLLVEARERGCTRMNLGLGINAGIGFFKRKWRAKPCLPYVETSWELYKSAYTCPSGGVKGRLFDRLGGLFR